MEIARVRSVRLPQRATQGSAGIDFFTPTSIDNIELQHGESALIPSGLKIKLDRGTALVFMNKSGVATKKGLQVGACVIDEDYTDEVFFHLVNIGLLDITIKPDEKIIQGLVLTVHQPSISEVNPINIHSNEELPKRKGGFGSTN